MLHISVKVLCMVAILVFNEIQPLIMSASGDLEYKSCI